MRPPPVARAAGFSLIELLVTMVVVTVVLGAAVALFNSMNELSRAQVHQVDMQQAVRVAQREVTRLVQMAGRGGLAGNNLAGNAATTPALTVRNNVGEDAAFPDRELLIGGGATVPNAVVGTDVLTLRGVFTNSVYQLNFTHPTGFTFDAGTGAGTLVVGSRTPTGIPQDLRPLKEAWDEDVPEALLVVNAVNELTYAVVEFDPANSDFSAFPDPYDVNAIFEITVGFKTTGGNAAGYATLSPGGVLPNLDSPAFRPGFLGLLEEYRYYVREDPDLATRTPSEWRHKLSRARVFPGTETAYRDDDANLEEDIADNVFDLQVALGYDSSFQDGSSIEGFFAFDNEAPPAMGADDVIWDASDDADDWLFNGENDSDTLGNLPWSPTGDPLAWTAEQPQPVLYYARVTTLGRATRPDRGFQAPVLDRVEDHLYPVDHALNTVEARLHRREILQSIIDLRNLG